MKIFYSLLLFADIESCFWEFSMFIWRYFFKYKVFQSHGKLVHDEKENLINSWEGLSYKRTGCSSCFFLGVKAVLLTNTLRVDTHEGISPCNWSQSLHGRDRSQGLVPGPGSHQAFSEEQVVGTCPKSSNPQFEFVELVTRTTFHTMGPVPTTCCSRTSPSCVPSFRVFSFKRCTAGATIKPQKICHEIFGNHLILLTLLKIMKVSANV